MKKTKEKEQPREHQQLTSSGAEDDKIIIVI